MYFLRVGGVRTDDCGSYFHDHRDQDTMRSTVDGKRTLAATKNRAARSRIHLCEQRDRKRSTDHRDRESAVIPQSGSVDSEGHVIERITFSPGVRHIG